MAEEPRPTSKRMYFWHEGKRYLDVWAMDGKPFPAERTMNRVNGLKWILTYSLAAYCVFSYDWQMGEEHVFSEPRRRAAAWMARFFDVPPRPERGAPDA